jgi:HTH-type transcriptional regulator / antitoxin MqsA
MGCPSCGHPEMVTKICDEILSYGGKSVILHDMKGDFCPECGEGVWDAESYRRYIEEQARLLDSVGMEIRRIRKKLKMTQTEIAAVVGVGKMAFSRYERGQSRPAPSLVRLLRLMERHPELLAEIQEPRASVGQFTTRTVCSAPSTEGLTGMDHA